MARTARHRSLQLRLTRLRTSFTPCHASAGVGDASRSGLLLVLSEDHVTKRNRVKQLARGTKNLKAAIKA